MLLNGLVGEVHLGVAPVTRRVIARGEAQVEVGVHPDHQRVDVGHEHPLADVELAPVYQQRPLDGSLQQHLPRVTSEQLVELFAQSGDSSVAAVNLAAVERTHEFGRTYDAHALPAMRRSLQDPRWA